MNAQAERTPSTLMNPEFSSWPDDGNKHVMNGPNSIHVVSDASPIFQEYGYFSFHEFIHVTIYKYNILGCYFV